MNGLKRDPRPRTMKDAVSRGAPGRRDPYIREFLDEFYVEGDPDVRSGMIADEPRMTGDHRFDAYVAAASEHLALRFGLPIPQWCLEQVRFLRRAYFPCGLESLKATYIVESPSAFRRRMIFVEADPLYRPRRAEAPHATPLP